MRGLNALIFLDAAYHVASREGGRCYVVSSAGVGTIFRRLADPPAIAANTVKTTPKVESLGLTPVPG